MNLSKLMVVSVLQVAGGKRCTLPEVHIGDNRTELLLKCALIRKRNFQQNTYLTMIVSRLFRICLKVMLTLECPSESGLISNRT